VYILYHPYTCTPKSEIYIQRGIQIYIKEKLIELTYRYNGEPIHPPPKYKFKNSGRGYIPRLSKNTLQQFIDYNTGDVLLSKIYLRESLVFIKTPPKYKLNYFLNRFGIESLREVIIRKRSSLKDLLYPRYMKLLRSPPVYEFYKYDIINMYPETAENGCTIFNSATNSYYVKINDKWIKRNNSPIKRIHFENIKSFSNLPVYTFDPECALIKEHQEKKRNKINLIETRSYDVLKYYRPGSIKTFPEYIIPLLEYDPQKERDLRVELFKQIDKLHRSIEASKQLKTPTYRYVDKDISERDEIMDALYALRNNKDLFKQEYSIEYNYCDKLITPQRYYFQRTTVDRFNQQVYNLRVDMKNRIRKLYKYEHKCEIQYNNNNLTKKLF
jgi:hypothetical protein